MIDLLLVDGPYGMNKYPGDEIRTPDAQNLYSRVFAAGAAQQAQHVVVFGVFDSLAWIHETCRPPSPYELRRDIVWHKPDWTAGGNRTFAPRHELILHYALPNAVFHIDAVRVPYGERAMSGVKMKGGKEVGWQPNPLGARCPDVLTVTSDRLSRKVEGRTQPNRHACVKPDQLLTIIVRGCAEKGGLVVEPFVGSDSLRTVCERENRVYQGFGNAIDFSA